VFAQQTIPASRDAREPPPMAAATDADESTIALPVALCLRTAAATITAGAVGRPALDDIVRADVECQPDNTAIPAIAEHLVIPVELSPAGTVVTARPLRGRGSSWE